MDEIEIKLQVPAAQRSAVEAAVAGRPPRPRLRLQAAYQDTADRMLAAHGLALRLRKEGRSWVQTLKGAGEDGMTRFEHNVPRGAASTPPIVDPALHAGTPVGDRLLALMASAGPDTALQALFGTDIRRRSRLLVVRTPGRPVARVELAFDEGHVTAGEARLPICEFEVELENGSPLAVIDTARRWSDRHGLWLDVRSKAERGDLLSRGKRMAPARRAKKLELPEHADAAGAWQSVLRNCADQVLANASQVASGEHDAEHVHQLRVGLRRLRSAISFFEVPAPGLEEGATLLFRALGDARDQVMVQGEFGAELAEAMRRVGLRTEARPGSVIDAPPSSHPVVRAGASQAFLLDLIAAMHAVAGQGDVSAWRDRLTARLDRWHRRLVRGARRYAELDDEHRHALRKHAKRQRYVVEFCASLFERRKVRRYLKALRALQERLGGVSDVVSAIHVFSTRAPADPQATFALGWLSARREVMVAAAADDLEGFAKVPRFWKRG